jgi:hypothetical protein
LIFRFRTRAALCRIGIWSLEIADHGRRRALDLDDTSIVALSPSKSSCVG